MYEYTSIDLSWAKLNVYGNNNNITFCCFSLLSDEMKKYISLYNHFHISYFLSLIFFCFLFSIKMGTKLKWNSQNKVISLYCSLIRIYICTFYNIWRNVKRREKRRKYYFFILSHLTSWSTTHLFFPPRVIFSFLFS